MGNFFTQNLSTKLLAFTLAVFFWFFILSNENEFFVFPAELPIEAFNVPEGLAVVNNLGTAQVTIRVDQEIYKTLTPDNFSLYVDLQGLAAGTKDVDISVNSKKPEVTVISVSPATLSVTLEEVTQETLPVTYETTGEPSDNYSASLITQDDVEVVVSGAQGLVQEVDQVVAQVTLSGEEHEDLVRTVSLVAMDAEGNPIPNLTLTPSEVLVEVAVQRVQTQKSVGVKVNLAEMDDLWVSSLSVVPSTVFIQGDLEVLEGILYLETATVTVPDGKKLFQDDVVLILPEGVTLVDEEDATVEVTLSLTSLEPTPEQ